MIISRPSLLTYVCSAEGSGGFAAAAVGAAALLAAAPLFSPLVQIWLLAQKSKDEIEDTVRVKSPLQARSVMEGAHNKPYSQWSPDQSTFLDFWM